MKEKQKGLLTPLVSWTDSYSQEDKDIFSILKIVIYHDLT